MPSSIVIVGCGFPQLGLLRAAQALGLEILGLDANPNAVGVPFTTRFLQVSTGDPGAVARAVQSVGASAIATTGSELALTTTAAVAEQLRLPFYADTQTIYRCQAKDAMRSAYASAGLPVPRFCTCSTEQEVQQFVAKVGLPVVVKPAHGWGQRGVALIETEAELLPLVRAAANLSHGGGGAVIEECLRGHEISVNGWVENGELTAYAITDREVFPGVSPLGVMRSEITPSTASNLDIALTLEAVARGAKALGLRRGPCYTQVCLTEQGPVLFETAARCGGGFDADVTRLVSGVDLYRRVLGVALGDSDLEHEQMRADTIPYPAALVRFLAPPKGTVTSIKGLDSARTQPGVIDAAVYAKVGDRLEGLLNAASRIAHILCVGENRNEAVERADAAEQTINIAIAKPAPPPEVRLP